MPERSCRSGRASTPGGTGLATTSRAYSRWPFTELWVWLRSMDVLRSLTSEERAAMATARELTGLDLPTGSDVVELEQLRVVLPNVYEKLMRH